MSLFMVNDEKCDRCGMCILECPARIIGMVEPHKLPSWVDRGEERCINCGHCVTVCPLEAISLETMKPEDCALVRKELLPTQEQVEHFLRSRRSIRVYEEKPVPKHILAKLVDIARYAPSGRNSQPINWLVVQDSVEVKRLAGLVIDWMRLIIKEAPYVANLWHFDFMVDAWECGLDTIMRDAPHVIVGYASKDLPLAEGNCGIALTYLELAAYSQGLGACWAGWFQAAATFYPPMAEALHLPEGHQSYGAMMIGYPKHTFHRIPLRNEPTILWR